ncbi:MAG: glycyl radical protein [bacterium]|nr:glycyl radical protein [bacterium]
MNTRVRRLRDRSLASRPSISAERALLLTDFYRREEGKHPVPVLRALAFQYLCAHKTIHLGDDELIVGERGPAPLVVPTFPELTCHSTEDLRILDAREKTSYAVDESVIAAYEETVIPFWRGRSIRDRAFPSLPNEWHAAYAAGVFTEFMEQRAPGHTVADDKFVRKGLLDLQAEIDVVLAGLDPAAPDSPARRDQLTAMRIAADATMLFARRHAERAQELAAACDDPSRRVELETIAAVCTRVPAHRPETFREALQAYWFHHLGVVTELNGWDAFSPGHLDQHLGPFYARELAAGTLNRDRAKELLECFWVKFNNHPAPPKVGVTAQESGTYTDFANINLGGLTPDGRDASNEVSLLLLEVIDEMHILQPSNNVQISTETSDRFLQAAAGVIRKGYGFPSVFNADAVVKELMRQGKSLTDARAGGNSGCVETGAFGKEAYVLTGYFNLAKLLELVLHDGRDPRTGEQLGPPTGDPRDFESMDQVLRAWEGQLEHFIGIKVAGNAILETTFAEHAPAPYLSLLIDDCIAKGGDYNAGGARYNTSYIQGVGTGTLTDSLAALDHLVFATGRVGMGALLDAMAADFAGAEPLRQLLVNKPPKYGNDDDRADRFMQHIFGAFFRCVDGRPNGRGGTVHVNMLPTTCHVYFGSVIGATPDGRRAHQPLSEGISPVQGADRKGPTAVLQSAAKMDHVKTGGTLLNLKFSPQVLEGEAGLDRMAGLVRGYFAQDGHHVQFNVVTADTLHRAQDAPEQHRHLIVRVAGYSDYFCDLSRELQDEIIARTEHAGF